MSLALLFNITEEEVAAFVPVAEDTGRLFLAYGNYADAVTLSGGGWLEALPLANLKDRLQAKVARSENASVANTKFDIDLRASKIWRVLSLVAHNFSLEARYRIRAGSDPTFTSIDYDSGWTDVWPALFNTIDLDWGDANWWSGRYTEEQRQGYNWTLIHRLPNPTSSRYIRVEIDDEANQSSYVQIGRLFVANGWTPSHNMSVGASLGWVDESSIDQAYGGAEFFGEKPKRRAAKLTLEAMEIPEIYARAFEIMRRAGTTREVLFMWADNDTLLALQRQFVGRLDQLTPIDHPYPENVSVAFSIRELL